MAKKNNKIMILLILIGLLIVINGGKKEAVIADYVNAGESVSVMGEMYVKESATSWVPGPADKIHWLICSDSNCLNIIKEGYESLTSSEKSDLNDRLTDPVSKTTIYYMSFTAPTTAGTYYYEGQAETSGGLDVISINVDGYINFGNSNRFQVLNSGVPCSDYTDEEIVDITNGIIRVTVYHHMSGTEPNCEEDSSDDTGFIVVCDAGYTATKNGRQSTCTLTQTQFCQDTDGAKDGDVKGTVTTDESQGCENGCTDYCTEAGTSIESETGIRVVEFWCESSTKKGSAVFINCPNGCQNGKCVGGSCTPNCAGKECGSDGCGGSCGTCPTGETCSNGICTSDDDDDDGETKSDKCMAFLQVCSKEGGCQTDDKDCIVNPMMYWIGGFFILLILFKTMNKG